MRRLTGPSLGCRVAPERERAAIGAGLAQHPMLALPSVGIGQKSSSPLPGSAFEPGVEEDKVCFLHSLCDPAVFALDCAAFFTRGGGECVLLAMLRVQGGLPCSSLGLAKPSPQGQGERVEWVGISAGLGTRGTSQQSSPLWAAVGSPQSYLGSLNTAVEGGSRHRACCRWSPEERPSAMGLGAQLLPPVRGVRVQGCLVHKGSAQRSVSSES